MNQCQSNTLKNTQCERKCEGKYCYQHKNKNLYLDGPVSLYEYYSSKYKKHIYLLGDYHSYNTRCFPEGKNSQVIKLIDFFKDTIKENKDDLIDYYLEAPYSSEKINSYIDKNIPMGKLKIGNLLKINFTIPRGLKLKMDFYFKKASALVGTFLEFDQCLKYDKKKCKYKNVRFHYCDVRILKVDLYEITLYALANNDNINMDIVNIKQDHTESKNLKKKYIILYEILKKYQNLFPLNINNIFNNYKINKQSDNVKDDDIINVIYDDYLSDAVYIYIQNLQFTDVEFILNDFENDNIVPLLNFYASWSIFQIILMDLYLLFRMFRSYNNGPDSSKIIIYAGDIHIQNYKVILEKLGFEKRFETTQILNSKDKNKPFQCLDITDLHQPLFDTKL
jgi:hypothetical protein